MKHEHRYLSCEPTSLTLASLAIAGAGAGASIAGQSQANSAANQVEQQKANAVDEQIKENRRRATSDYIAKVQDEQLQQVQEQQRLAEQELDLSKRERHASSQATVAAAESGVAGQSLAAIQADYRLQMDQAAARLGVNQDQANYQHTRNIQAYGVEYNNRATSIQPYQKQPVKPVDYFGPIFGAVGQGLNTGVNTQAFVGSGQSKANPLALVPPNAGGPVR
jgi:hypothetical protein